MSNTIPNYQEIQISILTDKYQRELIVYLWENYFRKNKNFYYLHEVGYLLIRTRADAGCSEIVKGFVREWGEKYGFELDFIVQPWAENSDIVYLNHAAFYEFMRNVCVSTLNGKLTLEDSEAEFSSAFRFIERIFHCYCNVTGVKEIHSANEIAFQRAYMNGYVSGTKSRDR